MADHLYVIQRRFAFYGFWFPQKSGQIGPEYARTVDPKVGGSIPLTHAFFFDEGEEFFELPALGGRRRRLRYVENPDDFDPPVGGELREEPFLGVKRVAALLILSADPGPDDSPVVLSHGASS